MKYYIISIALMLFSLHALSQVTPWYYGGKSDGHASVAFNNFTPTTLAHQVCYTGHKGDGSSMFGANNYTPTALPHQVAYAGFKGDGSSMSEFNNFTPTSLPHFTAYQGFKGDGSTVSGINHFTPTIVKQYVAYFGGKGDGWSNELAQAWPLPLVLVSFDGIAEKDHNLLNWKTSMEENVDYFLLEKSRDANEFKSIAQVNAVGFSKSESQYSYNDREDIYGVNYYRLKMTDNDTKFTYSKIIRLINEQFDYDITLSPNPANDNIRLSFSKALDKASKMLIYDMNGKIVASSIIEKDESVKNINISALSSGKYIIQLNTANENVNFPFIKQ
jgi:hypothetical protein